MATNYTANYGLCQWEPEDSFIPEEFNQDNAKIDAALAEARAHAGLHLIRTGTTVAGSIYATVPLGDIDWTEWKAVHVLITPYLREGSASATGHLCWSTDLSRSLSTLTLSDKASATVARTGYVIIYPLKGLAYQGIVLGVANSGASILNSGSFTVDTNVTVRGDGNLFFEASEYSIWGER